MTKEPKSEQRIAFEDWYKHSHTSANLVRIAKGYIDNTTRVAWRAWQAAQTKAEKQEPVPESTLMALARRCLWIAYCWNDHNFDAAHWYAQQEAKKHGITSFDQANNWLENPQPKREPLTDEDTVALIKECRDAFAEELSAWDIDPPFHHVQQGHDNCVKWLAAHGIKGTT